MVPRQRQPPYFVKAGQRERIVIPIHGNLALKIGLLKSLMKIAGLGEDEL
jgi:predicted RNA binding protein YcfA (HicA-like mRNA interferase family)